MEKIKKRSSLYLKLSFIFFFLAAFLISVYYLFPYEKVKVYCEVKLSEAASCDVEIGNLEFGLFSGIKFTDIIFKKNIKGVTETILDINELNAGSFYSSFILYPKSKKMSMKIKSKIYGGEVRGTINISKKNGISLNILNFTLKNVNISKNNLLKKIYNVDVSGLLNGKLSFNDISEDINSLRGTAEISIINGGVKGIVLNNVGNGMLRFDNMKLPDILFKKIDIDFKKEQRVVKVKNVKVEGKDIKGNISGNINLSKNIKSSSGNLSLKVNLSQDYLKKDEVLSLFDESFKSLKDSEGFYNLRIEGMLSKPRVRTL
jgi:type II secretion system protein N